MNVPSEKWVELVNLIQEKLGIENELIKELKFDAEGWTALCYIRDEQGRVKRTNQVPNFVILSGNAQLKSDISST